MHEAVAKYQRGEELSGAERELLTPTCAQPEKPSKEEIEAELQQHKDSIPEGWELTGTRMDDEFIYVTMKRECVDRKPTKTTVADKVRAALELFFVPGFNRERRVQYSSSRGIYSPIVPGAG